jgi:hypothetical protein
MTPAEAKALSAPEYMAFLKHMDMDFREQKKALKKRRR